MCANMKILHILMVALCCVAVSGMAVDYVSNPDHAAHEAEAHEVAASTDHGKRRYGATEDERSHGQYDNAAKDYNNAADNYAAHGNDYHKSSDSAQAKGDAAAHYYGQRKAAHALENSATAAKANRNSYNNDAVNKSATKDAGLKNAAKSNYAKKNYYRKGDVVNSAIHYGFDKKYKKVGNDEGDFELIDDSSDHSIDEYRDKSAGYAKANKHHADSKRAEDAAHALKNTKYASDARKAHHDKGKYASQSKRAEQKGAAKRAYDGELNHAAGIRRYHSDARDAALSKYNDFAAKKAHYNRQNAANDAARADEFAGSGLVGSVGGTSHAGYGHNDINGHVGHKGHGEEGHRAIVHGDHENSFDVANNAAQGESNKYGSKKAESQRHRADTAYQRHGQNNVHGNNVYDSGNAASKKNGFSFDDGAAAASKHGFSNAGANAANYETKKNAAEDSADSAFAKDNLRRKYHDAAKKHHVVKKFHHHTDAAGNNYERLNYDKKDFRDHLGKNGKAAHADASMTARNYDKNVENAAKVHQEKESANKATDNHKNYDAADMANANGARKSNYFNRDATKAARAVRDGAKKGYSNHESTAAAKGRNLDDYAFDNYGNNAHAYNGAHRTGNNFDNYGQHHGFGHVGFGQGIGFGVGHGSAPFSHEVPRGTFVPNGQAAGRYHQGYRTPYRYDGTSYGHGTGTSYGYGATPYRNSGSQYGHGSSASYGYIAPKKPVVHNVQVIPHGSSVAGSRAVPRGVAAGGSSRTNGYRHNSYAPSSFHRGFDSVGNFFGSFAGFGANTGLGHYPYN